MKKTVQISPQARASWRKMMSKYRPKPEKAREKFESFQCTKYQNGIKIVQATTKPMDPTSMMK